MPGPGQESCRDPFPVCCSTGRLVPHPFCLGGWSATRQRGLCMVFSSLHPREAPFLMLLGLNSNSSNPAEALGKPAWVQRVGIALIHDQYLVYCISSCGRSSHSHTDNHTTLLEVCHNVKILVKTVVFSCKSSLICTDAWQGYVLSQREGHSGRGRALTGRCVQTTGAPDARAQWRGEGR